MNYELSLYHLFRPYDGARLAVVGSNEDVVARLAVEDVENLLEAVRVGIVNDHQRACFAAGEVGSKDFVVVAVGVGCGIGYDKVAKETFETGYLAALVDGGLLSNEEVVGVAAALSVESRANGASGWSA